MKPTFSTFAVDAFVSFKCLPSNELILIIRVGGSPPHALRHRPAPLLQTSSIVRCASRTRPSPAWPRRLKLCPAWRSLPRTTPSSRAPRGPARSAASASPASGATAATTSCARTAHTTGATAAAASGAGATWAAATWTAARRSCPPSAPPPLRRPKEVPLPPPRPAAAPRAPTAGRVRGVGLAYINLRSPCDCGRPVPRCLLNKLGGPTRTRPGPNLRPRPGPLPPDCI